MNSVLLKRFGYILSVAVLLFSSITVSALPEEDLKAIYKNSVHHKFQTQTCGQGAVTLSGNSNIAKAYNYLVSKGLQSHQAAGIVGNLIAESAVIPNRKQGSSATQGITDASQIVAGQGFGIAQWTGGGRQESWKKFATQNNMDPLSLELQLMYLWNELETVPNYGLEEIRKSADIRQATWVFLVFFERPASTSGYEEKATQATSGTAKSALDERTGLSESVLSEGSGSSSSATAAPTTATCGSGGSPTGNEAEPDFKKNASVSVDEPPLHNFNEADCTGKFTVGAQSLSDVVMDKYSPPVTSVGGYACRQNTASNSISVHGVGRALDIMVDSTTPNGLATGDRIRNFMINNAKVLGVQRVIWNHHIWSADQDGWRDYSGPNPHTDHLHVEINEAAAKNASLGK